jgi:hypothetical protein
MSWGAPGPSSSYRGRIYLRLASRHPLKRTPAALDTDDVEGDRIPRADGDDQDDVPRVPWWMGQRVRLSALVVCLAIAVLGLLSARSNILSSRAGARSAGIECVPTSIPSLTTATLHDLLELRTRLLPVMAPINTRRHVWGPVPPEAVWSDNLARGVPSARLPSGLWPSSYEMGAWGQGENVVADVFLFANSRQARRFFEQASSAHCHRHGSVQPASRPPQARNLVWVNPDGPTQEDVFLLRGRRVYRVGRVGAGPVHGRPTGADQAAGVAKVDALACNLSDARCPEGARKT